MNDFTKQDLQYLLIAVDYIKERTTNCSDALKKLKKKLGPMIDGYCEHNKHETSAMINYCHKCDKAEFICL